ncbi:MAG: RepB family plasmid replication initiator protein [Cetobacterium sp.]
MKPTVKYHNDINRINFSTFSEKELNLFFTICFKVKNQGENELNISFQELKQLALGDKNLPRFLKSLKSIYTKLMTTSFQYTDDEGFGGFVLFDKYYVNEKKKIVTIRVGKEFLYMLNDLLGNYTKFDLMEFVSLKSSYSKNMFKLLKQWESTRNKEFNLEELKEYLGVPETYDTNNFNKKVLKPIITELPDFFNNLKLEKIKTGKKITHLKFSWDIRKNIILEKDEIELELKESLNSIFQKAKLNRFLLKILTDKNIHKLAEKYDENQLKKGLIYLYKNINKEIPSFSYLIKALENGIQEQKIKIKVIPEIEDAIIIKDVNNQNKILEEDTDSLFRVYLDMPENIKEIILQQAKEMYMKDVNIEVMVPMHNKFFKAAEKKYVLKILGNQK